MLSGGTTLSLELCLRYDDTFGPQGDLLNDLTKYAVQFRYPGETATRQDFKSAPCAMKIVRHFVREKLEMKA